MASFVGPVVEINGTLLAGCRNLIHEKREVRDSAASDGSLYQVQHSIIQVASTVSFETTDIHGLFSLLEASNGDDDAVPFLRLNGSTGFSWYGLRMRDGTPGLSGSSNHQRTRIAAGLLVFLGLSWSAGGEAVARCQVFAESSNGTTDPVSIADNIAAPTLPAESPRFVLESLTGDGTIQRVQSLSIDATAQLDNASADSFNVGLPYPLRTMQAGACEIVASIELHELDAATAEGTTAVAAKFREVAQGGVMGSGANVTLTVNGARSAFQSKSAPGAGRATKTVEVLGRYASATRPLTWAVAAS